MIRYRTLDKTDNQVLHRTFVEAFGDYQVKMDLPFWKFQQMLQRRGYRSEISMGAFEGGVLVGFALSGFRSWNGRATVYDVATGVVPKYRRQGITSGIFLRMKGLLQEKQVEQYLLEVIKSNRPAVQLYQKQGFKIQREFLCFQLKKDLFVPRETCSVERVQGIDCGQVKNFWDYQPSWQNSAASVNAVPEAFAYFAAKLNHTIVGYGIVDQKTGDIPQLAVSKDYRGNGIGGRILTALVNAAESKEISALNVEANPKSAGEFWIQSGFAHYADQYEMLLTL